MTSFSSTPSARPADPVLRMRDPGELLAALPYLMGFHPRDSLVVVAFAGSTGRRVGLTQRIDLPPPEHAPPVGAALARNVARTRAAAAGVLVVGGAAPEGAAVLYGAAPPRSEVVAVVSAALEAAGVPVRMRVWTASTAAGAAWACYGDCACRGTLPDPGATPLAAAAVAAGVVVHPQRTDLERLVAPAAADVLRRRERLLTRAIDAEAQGAQAGQRAGEGRGAGAAVVDAALTDTAAGELRLDDGRVLALAVALSDPLVRDAALLRCADPGAESGEQLWAALARETPDPEAAEPAALLAACALLRGDGALAGIALDRAEQAWPGHRLTGLLRTAWQAGMRPEQVRECLRTAPLPPAARARLRRRGRRR